MPKQTTEEIIEEFSEKFKGWILQDDQENHRSFQVMTNWFKEKLTQTHLSTIEEVLAVKPKDKEEEEKGYLYEIDLTYEKNIAYNQALSQWEENIKNIK